MARQEKLLRDFRTCRGPFRWRDFKKLIEGLGYEEQPRGKTGGSRRKFYNSETDHMLFLDEPHDGEMGSGMVRRLRNELEEKEVI